MALSMTGCGEGVATVGANSCRVELRTVNNRFFKLSLRTREGLNSLEPQIEAAIRKKVRRGTVQMTLEIAGPLAPGLRRLDQRQLEVYLDDLETLCAKRGISEPRSIDGLLGLPGVCLEAAAAADTASEAWPLVDRALHEALAKLEAMRRAEGETLAADLRTLCAAIRSLVDTIRDRVPAAVEEHRGRLQERIRRLMNLTAATLPPGDLAREMAVLADRSDVAEELVRLESHIDQFDHLLGEDAPGRALDFLSQELAREANTIASKSSDVSIAHAVVEMKTQIERLREQVQNIE